MSKFKSAIFLPLIGAILLASGVYFGSKMGFGPDFQPGSKINKINQVLNIITDKYVDPVSKDQLIEQTLKLLLQDLDPHSSYSTPEELRALREQIEGNFDGIGVEFRVVDDTLTIVRIIPGGPSELAGVKSGDKIVTVDDSIIAGVHINETIMHLLKGKRNTKVTVGIVRKHFPKILHVTITRGVINTPAVVADMMLNDSIGYIKFISFSRSSYDEFISAAKELKTQGMTKLIFDLRDNGGGLMDVAINISDAFLEEGKLIVYTLNNKREKTSSIATKAGILKDVPVVVLINHNTASASEIVTGALQDNDRCTVIGTRSFGKGLVQEPMDFADGSGMKLTIARYYTPTGRCIQRPYTPGNDYEKYYTDPFNDKPITDTTPVPDSLKFVTPKGKIVLGGGGITPDIILEPDSIFATLYYLQGIISNFTFKYLDNHRIEFEQYQSVVDFDTSFTISDKLYNLLAKHVNSFGMQSTDLNYFTTDQAIRQIMKAEFARSIWGSSAFWYEFYHLDNVINSAILSYR